MKPKLRIRLVAVLALFTMLFSITERAFADDCAHTPRVSADASSGHAAHQVHGPAADRSSESADPGSRCQHGAAAGCATSAQLQVVRSDVVNAADEVVLLTPPSAAALDLITVHTAFHPPRI